MIGNTAKLVFLTDLHLGHPKVPAAVIHAHLEEFLYPQLTDDVDFLILGGDFFHGMITFDSNAGLVANTIIQELRLLAHQHQFLIRGIRGTFTHDRNQTLQMLIAPQDRVPKIHGRPLINIHDQIAVERYDWLNNLSMVFLPDIVVDNMLETAKVVIRRNGLDRVDLVVHHGFCTCLLPKGVPLHEDNVYTCADYRTIAHGPVLNGHVHTPQIHEQIVSGGSFDRLKHDEEEPKGFFVVTYDTRTHQATYDFKTNDKATPFHTIVAYPEQMDNQMVLRQVTQLAEQWADHPIAFVRIKTDDRVLRQAIKEVLKAHRHVHPSFEKLTTAQSAIEVDPGVSSLETLPQVTPDTLAEAIVMFARESGQTLAVEHVRDTLKLIEEI